MRTIAFVVRRRSSQFQQHVARRHRLADCTYWQRAVGVRNLPTRHKQAHYLKHRTALHRIITLSVMKFSTILVNLQYMLNQLNKFSKTTSINRTYFFSLRDNGFIVLQHNKNDHLCRSSDAQKQPSQLQGRPSVL